MIDVIEDLEKKNFRVSVFPRYDQGKWVWVAGVYVGNETKAHWIDSNNGLPYACYPGYREAFNKVVDYCNNGSKKQKRK